MSNIPLVSVVMPVYNGKPYLEEAIESILCQTFRDFELIIINDGSTDDSETIINNYKKKNDQIRTYSQENQGLVQTLNRGFGCAKGRYVARMDADDISLPQRLEQQVRILDTELDVAMVGSSFCAVDEKGRHTYVTYQPVSDGAIRWHVLFHNPFAHTSVMLRASVMRKNNLQYDDSARHAEDYDLWSRLLCFGKGRNIRDPLVKYRRHSQRMSSVFLEQQQEQAIRISARNLKRLGVALSDKDVKLLREWYHRFPKQLTDQDIVLCCYLLDILDEFGNQSRVEEAFMRGLRYRWVKLIISSLSFNQVAKAWKAGLLKRLADNSSKVLM